MVFLLNPPEADKSLRYTQKIILGILHICLRLFFSHALILNKNTHLCMDTDYLELSGSRLVFAFSFDSAEWMIFF